MRRESESPLTLLDQAQEDGKIKGEKQKKETAMTENKFPAGWGESRVREVLAHYEGQTEDGAVAQDEAEMEPSEAVMKVPHDLVPIVRELIAKRQR